jgi:hypothetical protein
MWTSWYLLTWFPKVASAFQGYKFPLTVCTIPVLLYPITDSLGEEQDWKMSNCLLDDYSSPDRLKMNGGNT